MIIVPNCERNGIFLVTSKDGEEPGQGGVSVLISPVKLISVTQPQHSPLSDLCYPPLVNTHGAVPTLVHPAKLSEEVSTHGLPTKCHKLL